MTKAASQAILGCALGGYRSGGAFVVYESISDDARVEHLVGPDSMVIGIK